MTKQRAELTFKENRKNGKHGWLRLTPAYSIKIVHQILDENPHINHILDPFSGTGTTGLVAAERSLNSTLLDVNPFLIWLAKAKTANYSANERQQVIRFSEEISHRVDEFSTENIWIPPISNIDRWWHPNRLSTIAKIFAAINQCSVPAKVSDLLIVGFCRLMMQWSNAAFNHQSMSFDSSVSEMHTDEQCLILESFSAFIKDIVDTVKTPVQAYVNIVQGDARCIQLDERFDGVITSPPYVNRMSYVRELRPYMYWLSYLNTARDAGEMDWQTIGGTWGIATSRLKDWKPKNSYQSKQLDMITNSIADESQVLSNYVHKYMEDMFSHFLSLKQVLQPHARLFYIVGNSKFYDTLVPAQDFYADMMSRTGFKSIKIETIRKRNSKKELFEYLVSATNG